MPKAELTGALFFSKEQPHITGYLIVAGIEYEIAGWHATTIRADIKAAKRNPEPEQIDIFDGSAGDATGRTGESECDPA